jgi:endo-1,3(4)-beta-glucanase
MLEALRRTERASIGGRGSFRLGGIVLSGLLASFAACGGSSDPAGAGGNGQSSSSTAAGGSGSGGVQETWKMGSPFSTAALLTFGEVTHPLPPNTGLWGIQRAPYPTNAEWMNLVLGAGKKSINILPYVINVTDLGFDISAPKLTATSKAIVSAVELDLSFRSGEVIGARSLTGHDLLSVTMQWSAGVGKTLTAPLVRGMPYATAIYTGITPFIASPHGIVKVNGASPSAMAVMSDRFEVELNNKQKWVIYANPSIAFTSTAAALVSTGPYNGALRAALVGPEPDALMLLDKHRNVYPTGGDVTAEVTGDTATIGFTWKKLALVGGAAEPLLMMALPHHLDTLKAQERTDLTISTIKGDMVAVTGDAWTLTEELSKISWSAPSGIVEDKVIDIKAALTRDAAEEQASAEDVYTFGKQIAKLGRLAVIADELKDEATASAIRDKMKTALEPWLQGKNADGFKYDETWGGVCTTSGLANPSNDSGQGWYNDHHFQYGYFLYAAAAITKSDKAWFKSHREAIVALARDIANPSPADLAFTLFRHKDWFTGHSWAAGLFEFDDSRNQGSTSEAVNAWYSLYLLGLAGEEQDLANVGRVLLATEIRSAQKYWHIKQGSPIYKNAEVFTANKVVGVLWSTKVEYSTSLGSGAELIHGIQMLPFTPITEALLEREWVTEEYPVFSAAISAQTEQGWKGFAYMDHAIIDAKAAWLEVKALQGYDSGNSQTNTLYWVATRPAK